MRTGSQVVSLSPTAGGQDGPQCATRRLRRTVAFRPVRLWTRLILVAALGGMLGLPAQAADRVDVRAGAHRDYGRLVFEWPQPSGFEARIINSTLTVQFDRPFEADLDTALATLNSYILDAQHDQNGATVRFSLKGQFSLRSSHYDTSVVLDLMHNDATSSLSRTGGSGIRVGEHIDFTRTVFDWPLKVQYGIDRRNEQVAITFKGVTGNPDLSRFQSEPPRLIENASTRVSEDNLVITFQVAPGTGIRHFRNANKVVIDVLKGSSAATKGDSPSAKRNLVNESEPSPSKAKTSPQSLLVEVVTLPAPNSLLPADAHRLEIQVSSLPVGVRLVFPWENPTPAAIFQRAGYVWAVFDRPSRADFSALTADYSNRVITAEQLGNQHATVLRFKVPEDRYISAIRNESDWVVDITEAPSPPDHPLTVERELDLHDGARIFVPAVDTGNRWDLRDPEVGDILAIVPIQTSGHGMPQERLFAEFHLLRSAQGVVIQPLSERVDVEPRRNGVRIIAENGLILSTGRLPKSTTGEEANEVIDLTSQVIDYTTWRGDPNQSFLNNRNSKMPGHAVAHDGERNFMCWNVARFFFAHDNPQEAIGILKVIASKDKAPEVDPEFLLLRGPRPLRGHGFG